MKKLLLFLTILTTSPISAMMRIPRKGPELPTARALSTTSKSTADSNNFRSVEDNIRWNQHYSSICQRCTEYAETDKKKRTKTLQLLHHHVTTEFALYGNGQKMVSKIFAGKATALSRGICYIDFAKKEPFILEISYNTSAIAPLNSDLLLFAMGKSLRLLGWDRVTISKYLLERVAPRGTFARELQKGASELFGSDDLLRSDYYGVSLNNDSFK